MTDRSILFLGSIRLPAEYEQARDAIDSDDVGPLALLHTTNAIDIVSISPLRHIQPCSLLFYACAHRKYACVDYLLKNGADPTIGTVRFGFDCYTLADNSDDAQLKYLFYCHSRPSTTSAADAAAIVPSFDMHDRDLDEAQEDCTICGERAHLQTINGCGHKFCFSCLSEWLCVQVRTSTAPTCPHQKCSQIVPFYTIKRCVSSVDPHLFDVFDSRVNELCLQALQEWRWCTKCNSGALYAKEDKVPAPSCTTACPDCKHESCALCHLDVHPRQTCSQRWWELRLADPEFTHSLVERYLAMHSKPCPQCKAPITKNGGCSHMTCAMCKYQFCWICLGRYQGVYTTGNQCPCPKQPAPSPPQPHQAVPLETVVNNTIPTTA
eukprot:TRINITY_DN3875_c1_g1_i1.p1 TRINITY_DN3875_c1_g1~~TRINITY_DN3875_c1_g1_i1.p1  ORF type:complete len:380 (-),score=31.66 TRINITY_DN3875_c1_g1_i1:28-1167(-)